MGRSVEPVFETGKMGIPQFDLTGKTAIITGAAGGIGCGIARTFAAYGCDLVLGDINEQAVTERAAEIAQEFGHEAIGVRCDVGSSEDRAALVDAAMERFGRIDVLVNNAGVSMSRDLLAVDIDEAEWDRVLDIDSKAVFFLSQRVARIMIEQERGSIINLSSVSARIASSRILPYAAAKASVMQMTRCMALEWARFNIRANCICPGYIGTSMTQETLGSQKAYDAITRPIPHNRKLGDPMDVAAAALFLACDCSDMVNGTPLFVDGGRSVW